MTAVVLNTKGNNDDDSDENDDGDYDSNMEFYYHDVDGDVLIISADGGLNRQIARGKVKMYARTEMLDLVLVDGHARGIITRDLVTGDIQRWAGDAVMSTPMIRAVREHFGPNLRLTAVVKPLFRELLEDAAAAAHHADAKQLLSEMPDGS